MAQQDSQASPPRFQYYLALIEDTTKLSDRRQTANDLFVGLNVVIFTGLGVLFYGSHLKTWWVTGLYAAISLLALGLNITWLRLNARYRNLINLRIEYMTQLETDLTSADVFPLSPERDGQQEKQQDQARLVDDPGQKMQGAGIFTVEHKRMYFKGPRFGFSSLERALIWIFMVAYVLATLGVGLTTYLISIHVIGHVSL